MAANLFAHADVAERYDRARPYFHPLAVERIKALLGLEARVPLALDVGCGTGQSSRALLAIADQVIGVDPAEDMLAQAAADGRIVYRVGPAENLPVAGGSVDLITAGLAFHWFDRPRFFAEARRVLKPSSWLVIYADGFGGAMMGNPHYARWNAEHYVARFPTPRRNAAPLGSDDADREGFRVIASETFTHEVALNLEQLIDYLTTQTNVIAAIESGSETVETARRWMNEEISPMFEGETATFPFRCRIDAFRRT